MTPTDTNKLPAEVLERMAKAYCFADPCPSCAADGGCAWFGLRSPPPVTLEQAQAAYNASPGPGLEAENARLRAENETLAAQVRDAVAAAQPVWSGNMGALLEACEAFVNAYESDTSLIPALHIARTAIARAKGE